MFHNLLKFTIIKSFKHIFCELDIQLLFTTKFFKVFQKSNFINKVLVPLISFFKINTPQYVFEFWNERFFLNFLNERLNFLALVSKESITLEQGYLFQTFWFWSLIQISDRPVMRKNAVSFEQTRLPKKLFAILDVSNSSITLLLKSLQLVANHLIEKFSILILALKSWLSEISEKKFYSFRFPSIDELRFPKNYSFDFLRQRLIWTLRTSKKRFKGEVLDFDLCITIMIVLHLKKNWS